MSSTNNVASSSRGEPSLPGPSLSRLACPRGLRGMAVLDKQAFVQRVPILSARVEAGQVAQLKGHPVLRGQLLDVRRTPSVIALSGSEDRLLRLRVESADQLPSNVREFLLERTKGFEADEVELTYDHWNASEVLRAILPDLTSNDVPSSFTQTGHIGHVNLRDEWLPYKHLIGQVLLDKNPKLRTIVNKLDDIHAQYRYFDMEVLAGEPDFVATVSESGCSFTLDFQKVYWNSRLSHEHERLVELFQPGEVVADVMAGVGPFAIPAAKKGCRVLGNDLNPEGVEWMKVNRDTNKVSHGLRVSEMDGRAFIREAPLSVWKNPFPPVQLPLSRKQRDKAARLARESHSTSGSQASLHDQGSGVTSSLAKTATNPISTSTPSSTVSSESGTPAALSETRQEIDHFVMNLPDSALTFLDAFRGAYIDLANTAEGYDRAKGKMPMIHVHCFTREMEHDGAERDILQRAEGFLGHPVSREKPDYNLHLVRSVAPNKDMYCLSFRLPRDVAFAEATPES